MLLHTKDAEGDVFMEEMDWKWKYLSLTNAIHPHSTVGKGIPFSSCSLHLRQGSRVDQLSYHREELLEQNCILKRGRREVLTLRMLLHIKDAEGDVCT
ncbi:hypothetical protein VNO78_11760 [Psophocarpus tetragonolobus]|uniref:Uncharacterized protein n=1 Tax=Psophocarpus tetragonolobus TaxID=3891 RepID=A0AAN9SM14_PSOTE